MKARISRTSALGALNPMQKEAVHVYVEQLWKKKQEAIISRWSLATCLALSDLYGFGDKRLGFVMRGIEDILASYAEENFTPSEARNGAIDNGEYDAMAAAMQVELTSRGSKIKLVGVEG